MSHTRILAAVTVLNAAFALLSVTQWHPASAADDRVADVLRGRSLQIVDDKGRTRASIVTYADSGSVVLRLVNPSGMPSVKLGASEGNVGLALIREEGSYIQVFTDGVKVTAGGRQRAAWP